MKSTEEKVSQISEYFNYFPSVSAKQAFFYTNCIGHFIYEKGYVQERNSYDSFLLMYIINGKVNIETNEIKTYAKQGQFVLLDCYNYHKYYTNTGYECFWLHFDGIAARNYYNIIIEKFSNVIQLETPKFTAENVIKIFNIFYLSQQISEAYISKLITDTLTDFLTQKNLIIDYTKNRNSNKNNTNQNSNNQNNNNQNNNNNNNSINTNINTNSKNNNYISADMVMENVISHISENFSKNPSIEELAGIAQMSPYYFIRSFKKNIGYTPHEYIVNIKIENAKYLLTSTSMSTKDICYSTGFSSESVFCAAFKKKTQMTPSQYRNLK